jgi:hypothetical protein
MIVGIGTLEEISGQVRPGIYMIRNMYVVGHSDTNVLPFYICQLSCMTVMIKIYFICVVISVSYAAYASKVDIYKGEGEGQIDTGASFDSDSNGSAVNFDIGCKSESPSAYQVSVSVYMDYEKYPQGADIKSDRLSFLKYKIDRAAAKAGRGVSEAMTLCLDSDCRALKWGYSDYDGSIASGFKLHKSDHPSVIRIKTDSEKDGIYAKVDLNRTIKRVCELKRSKIQSYP